MARLNPLLLAVLVACALGLVTSQHQARKRWAELEREQARTQQLEIEFGQLQLEAVAHCADAVDTLVGVDASIG